MTVQFQHERLRERRKEKRLTQEDLAELCGCSPRYLRALEAGKKSNPSGALIRRLTYILELSAEDLLTLQSEEVSFNERLSKILNSLKPQP